MIHLIYCIGTDELRSKIFLVPKRPMLSHLNEMESCRYSKHCRILQLFQAILSREVIIFTWPYVVWSTSVFSVIWHIDHYRLIIYLFTSIKLGLTIHHNWCTYLAAFYALYRSNICLFVRKFENSKFPFNHRWLTVHSKTINFSDSLILKKKYYWSFHLWSVFRTRFASLIPFNNIFFSTFYRSKNSILWANLLVNSIWPVLSLQVTSSGIVRVFAGLSIVTSNDY